MAARPRILSISFSEYVSDARVLRQLRILAEQGDVTTIGYGRKPDGATEHIELDESLPSLPQTPSGVAKLAARRYDSVELEAPATKAALALLEGHRFDLIVANEARALPLAFAVANGAPVWGDMHEWAPEERTHVLSWRLLVAPFMRHICAKYLPRAAAVTAVNGSIAQLYTEQFGCRTEVVRNAIAYQDLSPSPMIPGRVRLVHSGAAVPGRNLEALVDAALQLDERFTLDLYLVGARDGGAYLEQVRQRARGDARIRFRDPVAPADLPRTLNAYDLGIFSLPPRTTNHRLMLPNKFFDFVQARIGLVFSPAVETDALIRQYRLGAISEGFSGSEFAALIAGLDDDQITTFKANADAAASSLSSAADEETERRLLTRLLTDAPTASSPGGA